MDTSTTTSSALQAEVHKIDLFGIALFAVIIAVLVLLGYLCTVFSDEYHHKYSHDAHGRITCPYCLELLNEGSRR